MPRVSRYVIAPLMCILAAAVAQDFEEMEDGAVLDIGPVGTKYAEIRIAGSILETLPDVYVLEPKVTSLYDLVDRIDLVRHDDSVQGLVVRIDSMSGGWAKAQEIRQALQRVRDAGKHVYCHMDGGGNLECYVASVAERIAVHPAAMLYLIGIRGEVMFWKGLLDKIGVKGDMVQVGEFKGAIEPMISTEASESFRESVDGILDDYMRQLVSGIATGRGLKPEAVRGLIDQGPFSPRRAQKAGLVDEISSYEDMIDVIEKQEKRTLEMVRDYGMRRKATAGLNPQQLLQQLMGMGGPPAVSPSGGDKIAVLYAVGPIVKGDPDGVLIGESTVISGRIAALIRKLRDEPSVKAIVLRVESPGGSAQASDMIWSELRKADEVKPVIVSLSDVAASGGYYIAAAGRKVFASEGTLTGSIGVMGGKIVIDGLLEKLGLNVEVFERGKNSGMDSMVDEFSPAQRAIVRELMTATYELFVQRVSAGRSISEADVKKMAQGRVWTGHQALGGKLIDEIGGLSDAIAAAKEAAGIPEDATPKVVRLPKPRSIVEFFLAGSGSGAAMPPIPGAQGLLRSGVLGPQPMPPQLRAAYTNLLTLWTMRREHALALMPALVDVR